MFIAAEPAVLPAFPAAGLLSHWWIPSVPQATLGASPLTRVQPVGGKVAPSKFSDNGNADTATGVMYAVFVSVPLMLAAVVAVRLTAYVPAVL